MKIERFDDRGFLSDIVVYGPWIWIGGTVPDPSRTTIEEQTRDILSQIESRLETVGSSKSDLLNVIIWLSDIEDWTAMNGVWTSWLDGAPAPARAVVGATLMQPYKIEIAATAARSELSR